MAKGKLFDFKPVVLNFRRKKIVIFFFVGEFLNNCCECMMVVISFKCCSLLGMYACNIVFNQSINFQSFTLCTHRKAKGKKPASLPFVPDASDMQQGFLCLFVLFFILFSCTGI